MTTSPFQNVSTPDIYFPSSVHEEARARIFYAIKYDKGSVLFTGEVGMGKTTVGKVVVKRLLDRNINVGIISNPTLEICDFLREILHQLGVKTKVSGKLDLIHRLNDHFVANYQRGIKTILIIDEAHLITDVRILEEIRLLLNFQDNDHFLLTLVLIGQPELRKIIHSIPPLEQRLTVKYHLKHLSLEDAKNYIFHRLKHAGTRDSIFTMDAIKMIHRHTQGVPRRINQVCDFALLVGYSEKKHWVDLDTVKKVLADEQKHGCAHV
ncbi:MAG TPA: AAA family ATPase [Dissulfurispiraceae bacterium]